MSYSNIAALVAPLLTIAIAIAQLVFLCSWSKDEFGLKRSSCHHSKVYYQDLKISNITADRLDCEEHVDKAAIMNIVAIGTNGISVLLSLLAMLGASELVKGIRAQICMIVPYCIFHFFIIPITIFSDMYLDYVPLPVMIIGIAFYLIFISIMLAQLRKVSPQTKRAKEVKRTARKAKKLAKLSKKDSEIEKAMDADDMFADFHYKKMQPAFYSSN